MTTLTAEAINDWADNKNGPVALTCKQKLLPVEGESGVIFPPTYADIGYNIDTLSDGTKVATIDSVGSQANRMEPIFTCEPYAALVPQITIDLHKDDDDGKEYVERRSIFDLAHRSADAVVYSCPKLAPIITKAYLALKRHGDAGPLCSLAPTSLLFGVWDSRGGSGEKRRRLIRSIVRAWDVDPLYAAAQFNSIWKVLSEEQQAELRKEAKAKKTRLSEKGFADAPATFRKVSQAAARQMPEFRDGTPNPERRVLGGVVVKGTIERAITVNLVALRDIRGATEEKSQEIRRYLLGLSLLAATADIELFLREGCHLRFADKEDRWFAVPRRGDPVPIELSSARELLLDYAKGAVVPFKSKWPTELSYAFDLKEAKKLLAKKEEDEEE
ncbi:MAG TPA: type I-U CRISPR-associated RAMP protein Csb1/Cas7u [Alphaproteobacteria bacterium]|nr:type I-U CRISPR-associated RAMP protein Csb1/Cas7u [Alphaproteobacteria bacterium]